ncbi:hypothetical protein R1sor_026750 [Riccia sorocarpa]|uniref:Malectin-like domain-containing protein n=1 Tax=Riccia sorocarpa TaxID=122646 RepID=A0ABD3GC82_9MARC
MATQLHWCPECRATKLHHPVSKFYRIVMRILVLTSLYGTRICNGLPLEPLGYIRIDCGGVGGYNDNFTGLAWVEENDYLYALTEYCYNFNLSLSNKNSTVYLVRAMFPFPLSVSDSGKPRIVLDTLSLEVPYTRDSYEPLAIELLATALDDSLDVCLMPLTGAGKIGAISSLEVRSVPETLYPVFDHGKVDIDGRTVQDTFNYYVTQARLNFGGDKMLPAIR